MTTPQHVTTATRNKRTGSEVNAHAAKQRSESQCIERHDVTSSGRCDIQLTLQPGVLQADAGQQDRRGDEVELVHAGEQRLELRVRRRQGHHRFLVRDAVRSPGEGRTKAHDASNA